MASYLQRIFIIHDIYVSFAAEEGVHPRRCEARPASQPLEDVKVSETL